MDFYRKQNLTEIEKRRKLKREEWKNRQRLEREHEKRKSRMIKKYEKERAEQSKIDHDSGRSPIFNYSKNTINKEELQKIKIEVYTNSSERNQSTEKINRDVHPDITFPRRKSEGSCPIFEREEINLAREIKEMKIDNQSEKESLTNINTCKYTTDKDVTQYYSRSRFRRTSRHQDKRINENKHKSRSPSSSKNRRENYRYKKKDSSHSSRDSHNSRRSSSSRFSSRDACDNAKPCKQDARMSSAHLNQNLHMGWCLPYPAYNIYNRFPGPRMMFRGHAPPMTWPVMLGAVPMSNLQYMNRWQMPPPWLVNRHKGAHQDP